MPQSVHNLSINWKLVLSGRVSAVYTQMCEIIRCFMVVITLFVPNTVPYDLWATIFQRKFHHYINQKEHFTVSLFIRCHIYCHIDFAFYAGLEIDIMELITSMNIMEILNARLKSFSQKVFAYLLKPMLKFQKLVKVPLNHFSNSNIQLGTWGVAINRSLI